MVANYYGMYRRLDAYVRKGVGTQNADYADPREAMLQILQAPYNDLRNYDQFLEALRQQLSLEEAEVWCAYPDFTMTTVARTPAEVMDDVRPALRPRLEALTRSLVEKHFLFEDTAPNGQAGYIRTYFFEIVNRLIYHPDGTLLADACLRWWLDVVDGGDSAKLREPYPEYRVLPHEGTLTGDSQYGRIPMNLEIPDKRQVIPSIDRAAEILKNCRRFAVTACLCRVAKDRDHSRQCDFPVADVCLMFDAAADGDIAAGNAREITYEETLAIMRRCRDLGMVQIISNAEHPLCICNCCKCCCVCMRSLERYEDTVGETSRYAADAAHRENCIGCGGCVRACPMEAVSLGEIGVQVASQKCIGCGVCVSKCPKGVLKMIKRPGAIERIVQSDLERVYL